LVVAGDLEGALWRLKGLGDGVGLWRSWWMLEGLGDVEDLVDAERLGRCRYVCWIVEEYENIAGFERYIYQADEAGGLQKIPGAGLLFIVS
jgi:hypothetical protein